MSVDKSSLTVVIMAGGTGGHVFPALSVAEKLRLKNIDVHWLGTSKGIESRLVPAANIPIHYLTIEGVRGKGLLTKLKAPFLLITAVLQARKILKVVGADAVLGLGGFASGPGGVAAWLLKKPVVIHEQNAVAGTTNRWLAKIADTVLEAFPGSLESAVDVGNPVRTEIAQVKALSISDDRSLHLLVLGGSLGAQALNEMLPKAIAQMPEERRPQIKHQAGNRNHTETVAAYQREAVTAEVVAFIDDMAAVYEWADLVICRAGALTVSELTLAGRGAMLVPYPYAIDDHQTRNAEWLAANKAAIICQQSQLSEEKIVTFINSMNRDRSRLIDMAQQAKLLSRPNAAEVVANYCQQAAMNSCGDAANG